MSEFINEYWQWIIGAVLIPIVATIIGTMVKQSGRKQKIGNIHGNENTVINGDVKEDK